ncbi:MAG: histidinol-phosphatase [Planctomycetes bacterium]|nr:histidinol-phosphatase [Planctomycetota bacterium]
MNRTPRSRLVAITVVVLLLQASYALGQVRQEIRIPDIMGYKTLKCDFHLHTVFSDGLVWPTVRVDEAWREGLDAISITDHIEYQPHKQDVPTNHNRSYEIALPRAKERGILLVKGTEITRDTPPGHFNALFIQDVTPLDTKDLLEAMEAAARQGAFIWWNHPGWKPEHKGWFDIHTTLYEKKYLRGIEVVNGTSYYPEAHEWALSKNLTFIADSDMHAPSPLDKTTSEKHRPMTFVFVKEKTIEAIKEALVAGRTAIWFEKQVLGRREYVEALYQGAVRITDIQREPKVARFTITNDSDLALELQRTGKLGPQEVILPARTSLRASINVAGAEKPVELSYVVGNFLIAPEKGLPVSLVVAGSQTAGN